MGFIKLNRYADASGRTFDPGEVVAKARAAFSDLKVLPTDQLALGADRAADAASPEHVVRTLRRNQQEYGPAYAFEFDIEGGGRIQGRARRYDVTFHFAVPLTEEWRQRLLTFLQGLGPGRMEHAEESLVKPT
ncbi:MAG TPA: hypothetical protein VE988_18840 [Gemmataceae bacterium]|nr:hypothetical protein [Gemmataceae bacterium]